MSEAATKTTPSATFAFVKLIVADVEGMVDFYARVLGLTVSQTVDAPEMVEKILAKPGQPAGAASLILYHHKDGRTLTLGDAHGPVGFFVRGVDSAYAHALAEGAKPHRAPFDAGTLRVAFVLDPEGHEIELLSMKR